MGLIFRLLGLLPMCWAAAPTCKHGFGASGGSRRVFLFGSHLASAALAWCRVLQGRWILRHHAVRASFCLGRWSAKCCQPVRYSVVWPATWVSAVDKTRKSRSAEVRRIWEVYDECLQVVLPDFWEGIRSALLAGDVSLAWGVWSFAAETSLVRAFLVAGGTLPASGVRLGRRLARLKLVALGGPVVGKLRNDIAGSDDGQAVHLFKESSLAGAILQKRRLRCVLVALDGVVKHGFSLARSLELGAQWDAVVGA